MEDWVRLARFGVYDADDSRYQDSHHLFRPHWIRQQPFSLPVSMMP